MHKILFITVVALLGVAGAHAQSVVIETGDSTTTSVVETYSEGDGTSYVESKAVSNSGGQSVSHSQVNVTTDGETKVEGRIEVTSDGQTEVINIDSPGEYEVSTASEGTTTTPAVPTQTQETATTVDDGVDEVENIFDLILMKINSFLRSLFA